MGMLPITIRKRTITDADIVQIQATLRSVGLYLYGPEAVDAHWSQGRKHISKVLCRQWPLSELYALQGYYMFYEQEAGS
jgi:hypothetical protein